MLEGFRVSAGVEVHVRNCVSGLFEQLQLPTLKCDEVHMGEGLNGPLSNACLEATKCRCLQGFDRIDKAGSQPALHGLFLSRRLLELKGHKFHTLVEWGLGAFLHGEFDLPKG